MKHLFAVLAVLAVIAPRLAVAGPADDASLNQQAQKEQRRAELRSAMKAQRPGFDGSGAATPATGSRQLSAQERAELRQQLRQQQSAQPQTGRPSP